MENRPLEEVQIENTAELQTARVVTRMSRTEQRYLMSERGVLFPW